MSQALISRVCLGEKMTELAEKIENLRKAYEERKSGKSTEKRPRHYAQEIVKLKSREERKAALEKVPEEYRAMVKVHVETYFLMRIKQ
jgi:hypothetical protein